MSAALTSMGIVHTAISLVAVAAGVVAFVRDKEISPTNTVGKTYLVATLLTAVTGLFIFQHGGFGPPHVLSILTIVALAVGAVASYTPWYGRASAYIRTISFSATFLFHMIPGVTESTTRLPPSAPLLASADDPLLQKIALVFLVLFVIGVTLQIRRLRAISKPPAAPSVKFS